MARRDRPGNGTAADGSLVSEGGVAVRPWYDAITLRFRSSVMTWRRGVAQRLTAVDVVTLLYVAVATAAVLAFSGYDHASWDLLLTAHVLLVTLVLLAPLARQAGPLGRFLGDWYPMLLLGALYAEVGVLNVDLGYQHDQVIQRLELWVFGSQLSYRWIREMPNPLLSWFLHGCYLAYYAILYASPLGLWFSGRRDAARRTIFAVMVTFYICHGEEEEHHIADVEGHHHGEERAAGRGPTHDLRRDGDLLHLLCGVPLLPRGRPPLHLRPRPQRGHVRMAGAGHPVAARPR